MKFLKYWIITAGWQLPTADCQLKKGGLAQLARASALHAEGHRFDSDILHFFFCECSDDLRCNRKGGWIVQSYLHHSFLLR